MPYNAITPKFIKAHSFDVSPLSDQVDGMLGITGFGGLFSQTLGYVIIRVLRWKECKAMMKIMWP